MNKLYPSDISREQFAVILPILESSRKKTKPRKVDLYDIFCGILYVLKTGCQWRALPKEYPRWYRCHDYFMIWNERGYGNKESTLDEVLKKISWRGSTKQWSERENQLLYNRFTKREEH